MRDVGGRLRRRGGRGVRRSGPQDWSVATTACTRTTPATTRWRPPSRTCSPAERPVGPERKNGDPAPAGVSAYSRATDPPRRSIGRTFYTVTCSGKPSPPGPERDLSRARLFRRLCCLRLRSTPSLVLAVPCAHRARARTRPRPRPLRHRRPEPSTRTVSRAGSCWTVSGTAVPTPPTVAGRAAGNARGRCAGGAPRRFRMPPTRGTSRPAAKGRRVVVPQGFEAPRARQPTRCCASSRSTTGRPCG